MDYFSTRCLVREILEEYPEARDNDNLLIALVIKNIEEQDLKEISAFLSFKNLQAYKYRSLEGVTRARRKLQQQYPHLRGVNYAKRHRFQEEVQNQLYFAF